MTVIEIRTTEGERKVQALVFGAWAVHRPWRGKGWAITHVASGMCVPSFYTEDLTKPTAIRCAKALDERFPSPNTNDPSVGKKMADLIWKVALGGRVPS